MSDQSTTTFENKCSILADLWIAYKYDEEFQAFFEYADLGLPLAYAIDNQIIKSTSEAQKFIDEAFDVLIEGLGVEDRGYENLDDLLTSVED